jgi:S1-C subfamily serine protease
VTGLDWGIVAFTLLLALYGYLQGFIVGVLSLAGFALGAVLGTRIGPALLDEGSRSPYAALFGLAGALIAGGILASGFEGIGARVRRRLHVPVLGMVDGVLGAGLTACVALGIAWIGGAVALQAPGTDDLRDAVRRSEILGRLNRALPPSGPILNALARFDPLPNIRGGPEAAVPPPSGGVLRDPEVRAATRSVVRVIGTACGLGIEGSGWAAGDELVVTNAHVIAGESDTGVQVGGTGATLSATPVFFDPGNDVAVLRVPGLGVPALRLSGVGSSGASTAIMGYPENGRFDAGAGRLGATRTVQTQDAYGRGPVARSITSFRGTVRPGNSGGPLVDGDGRVAATVFAAVIGGSRPGGYGVPNAIVRMAIAQARSGGPASSGPCADG